jgi:DNA-binding MarR family transcriptional regulator
MEVMGWVTRAPDPRDRRVRLVFPTPKALDAFANFKPVADEVYAEALAGTTPEQRGQLLDALSSIVFNLAKAEEIGQKDPS